MTPAETCQKLFLTFVSACWGVCMHAAVSVDFSCTTQCGLNFLYVCI